MKSSYLVFGTRYCGWDNIFEWILTHKDVSYHVMSLDKNKEGSMKAYEDDTVFYYYPETSLVYHEDILFNSDLATYRKTIIVYKDLTDVIEKVFKRTKINPEKAISKQVELFEEYTDELIGETSKIHEPYFMPIFYDLWRHNLDYRNILAEKLGFKNNFTDVVEKEYDFKFRQKIKYKRQITSRVKELNNRI